MPRRRIFQKREPLAVTYRRNRAHIDSQISDPAQAARFAADFPASDLPALPVKRGPIGASGTPLEADVVRAVGDVLALHPRVLFALRINSGAASYEAATGRYAPVWFHKWVRSPEKFRMSDFFGATIDARLLALECKRPGWTKPTDQREREQAAFLALVRKVGGVGAFITDAEQLHELLR